MVLGVSSVALLFNERPPLDRVVGLLLLGATAGGATELYEFDRLGLRGMRGGGRRGCVVKVANTCCVSEDATETVLIDRCGGFLDARDEEDIEDEDEEDGIRRFWCRRLSVCDMRDLKLSALSDCDVTFSEFRQV